jgi:hypothetical protein
MPSRAYRRVLSRSEDLPVVGDALQGVCSTIDEVEPGTGNKISDGARDEHLARAGEGNDARGDVDAGSSHAVAAALDLAGVKARAHLETQVPQLLAQCERTADSPCRTVETSEQAVSGEVCDDPAEVSDLTLGKRFVRIEQLAPTLVAELDGACGRIDDVGEKDRREHPFAAETMTSPR